MFNTTHAQSFIHLLRCPSHRHSLLFFKWMMNGWINEWVGKFPHRKDQAFQAFEIYTPSSTKWVPTVQRIKALPGSCAFDLKLSPVSPSAFYQNSPHTGSSSLLFSSARIQVPELFASIPEKQCPLVVHTHLSLLARLLSLTYTITFRPSLTCPALNTESPQLKSTFSSTDVKRNGIYHSQIYRIGIRVIFS